MWFSLNDTKGNMRVRMMKKIALALTLAILLLISVELQLVNLATANFIAYLPYITIKSDGSVEPETELINRAGNTYTLTGDISRKYAVEVQCSNIVLDGAGHSINGSVSPILGYSNLGLSLQNVTNVTIKDLKVSGFMTMDISLENSNKSVFLGITGNFHLLNSSFNTITESNINLLCRFSNSNTIFRNNITRIHLDGYANSFFENNFPANRHIISWYKANFWDNGSIGNYWSGYGGNDANNDSIGDTPYIISTNNRDNYPLMAPYIVPPSPSPTPEPQPEPKPSSTELTMAASGITITSVVVCLLYFYKKRKPLNFG